VLLVRRPDAVVHCLDLPWVALGDKGTSV
jgi:hypothetical protein